MSDPTQNQDDQNTPLVGGVIGDQGTGVPSSVPTQSDLPPIPDFQNVSEPSITPPQSGTTTTPPSDFFPPAGSTSPKKKFGSGKIIATILGVLLLVGGVGAGILLITQPQLLQQKAAITSYVCTRDSDCSNGLHCVGGQCTNICGSSGHSCLVGEQCVSGQCVAIPPTPIPTSASTLACKICQMNTCVDTHNSNCNSSLNRCSINADCAPASSSYPVGGGQGSPCSPSVPSSCANGYSCVNGACQGNSTTTTCGRNIDTGAPVCCTSGCSGKQTCEQGRLECNTGGVFCTINTNSPDCMGQHSPPPPTSKPPTPTPTPHTPSPTPVPQCNSSCTTNASCPTGLVCSIGKCRNPSCTSATNCICTTPTPTPHTPTPTPTPSLPPTPGPSAVCVVLKAYDTGWSVLSSAQLSGLKAGNNINFCVSGTTSSGSFDMAKFTINGVAQPETTNTRPGSSDFCQAYTIPTNVTTFDVTAQIHHVTIGWVGP